MQFFQIIALALVLALPAQAARAHAHDKLNEQQLGSVHFPISCDASVQKTFERGVALLHSFAFDTAEPTFREVAAEDPHCAMAYWGIARTFSRWGEPDRNQREHGWQAIKTAGSLNAKTPREREYISAVAALYEKPERENGNRGEKYLRGLERAYKDYRTITKPQLSTLSH
jgi:hypothetical protein